MSFEYYQVEDEIVQRIQAYIGASSLDVDVYSLPDSDQQFKKGTVKPLITVFFAQSQAAKTISTDPIVLQEELSVICNIQSRSLRGNNDYKGCHQIARWLKEQLTGFQTTHCGRLYFKNYQPANPPRNEDDSIWFWEIEFGCTKLFTQADDQTDPNAPVLQQVTLNDQFE